MSTVTLPKSAGSFASRRVLPDLTEKAPAMPDLASLSKDQLLALVAELSSRASAPSRSVSFKVSDKGCVSVYGGRIRRFGMTFYATEWETILDHADELRAFISANASSLARK